MQMVFPGDAHFPTLSCVAPGSLVGRTQQLLWVQGCECVGSPTPLPRAACCWQAQSQPHQFSATSLSPRGAAYQGLSTGRTLPAPLLPAAATRVAWHTHWQSQEKSPRRGRCCATTTCVARVFHSKSLLCTLPHPERSLRVYE